MLKMIYLKVNKVLDHVFIPEETVIHLLNNNYYEPDEMFFKNFRKQHNKNNSKLSLQ